MDSTLFTRSADRAAHDDVNFRTRKWVKPEDLNANNTLFGGSLLRWVDEEAAIYATLQLGNPRCVTKLISEINFLASAKQGDMIEMGILDPAKVTRSALQAAASIGGLMITTEAMVADIVEDKAAPAMPDMGGMGGMGGMM